MRAECRAARAVRLEELEHRWLLSSDPGQPIDDLLYAPNAPQVVDANTITSIVATILAGAPAGDSIFMKYGDITGDVAHEDFAGLIELNSFQWGVGRGIGSPSGSGGREVSAPSVSEITVTKQFDSSSVPLIQEAFIGTPADVEIDFVNIGADESKVYLKVELDNTLLSGYSFSSGGGLPSESLSLNFTKLTISALDAQGATQSFTFDLAKQGAAFLPSSGAPSAAATPAPASTAAAAGGDAIFMRYGAIQGDVTANGFVGASQLNSFQWGVGRSISSPSGGGGREVSAPSVSEVVVTKQFDSASVPLIREAFIGDDAHVDADFANQTDFGFKAYLHIDLENTLISGYSMSSGGDRPTESLSLNFTTISISARDSQGKTRSFMFDMTKQASSVVAAAAQVAPVSTTTAAAAAAADANGIYMRYGAIVGDVTATGFEGAAQLTSFRWGVGRGIGSPSGGADRPVSAPSVSEAIVTKQFDSSSVPLIQEAFGGVETHVKTEFVSHVADKRQAYLKLELGRTLISGYSMSSGGDRPSESLSLNFTKITFTAINSRGERQKFNFDLAKVPSSTATATSAAASAGPVAAIAPAPAAAVGVDPIFMKYGDIKGEVTAVDYEGAVQLNSFQWGVGRGISSPTAGGGRQVSAPSVSEITVTKDFDSASVPLIREAFIGEDAHVDADFVNLTEQGTQPYLSFDLDNTLVSGYSMSSGGDRPSESLSLNFTKVTITALGATGVPQTFTFDLARQTAALVTASAAGAASASATSARAPSISAAGGPGPLVMRYGDIKGDVTAEEFDGAIALHSFQWGVGRGIGSPTAGGDREVSAPSISEIVVSKNFDVSSVPLIREAFIGEETSADIDFTRATEQGLESYLRFDLDRTMLSGYSMSSGGGLPSESLSLNYTKVSVSALDATGATQTFTFDLAKQVSALVPAAAAPATAAAAPVTTASVSPSGFEPDRLYMKYGDIPGEVTAEDYVGFIEVNSFQWGVGRSISSPTGGSGDREASAPSVSEIVVTKMFDSTSIPLIREFFAADDAHVDVDFVRSVKDNLETYLSFDLENTLVSGYSMSSGGDRPSESLSLNFTKVSIVSTIGGQTQTFQYDLVKQVAL